VKTLVRCGLRMPKSMGSQRFVSRVRTSWMLQYIFFAEDIGLLMRGWKRGGECSPERLFLLPREKCLD